jgi:hypothetical protein
VQRIAETFVQSLFVAPSVTRNVVSVTPQAVQVPAAKMMPLIRVSVIPNVGLYMLASMVAPSAPIPVEPLKTDRSPLYGVAVGTAVAVGTGVFAGVAVGTAVGFGLAVAVGTGVFGGVAVGTAVAVGTGVFAGVGTGMYAASAVAAKSTMRIR